jgi:hypothetical protein
MTLAIYSILYASDVPDSRVLITAPTDEQASVIFSKVKGFFAHIQTKEPGFLLSDTQRSCLLRNNSSIKAMTTGVDGLSVRGQTANVLVIDESAFIKQSIYNEVLMPTILATKGKIIEISTPFGRNNHFYNHCTKDKNWITHHVPWQVAVEAGHITPKQIEEKKNSITKMQFLTEYGAEFVDDQNSYFPLELIESCTEEYGLLREVDLSAG